MITVFVDFCKPISQKVYDDVICSLPFHQLTCTCGCSGSLTVHGYYERFIKSGDSSLRLRICRVLCRVCGRTHSLLPSSIVPYSQIPLPIQVEILEHSRSDGDFSAIMDDMPSVDESCVRSVIRRFRLHWEQRLLSEHIRLLPIPELIRGCFASFCRQFMQIKNTPNILFLRPT